MRRSLLALLLCSVGAATQAGDIQVDAQDVYYEVVGTTATEILDDLQRQAGSVGQDYFAQARWHVRWNYDYDQRVRNICRAKNLRLHVIQRTTLPRWSGAGAAPELVAQWQKFMDALRLHEKGHTDHGVQAAQAIAEAVRPVRAARCSELAAEVNRIGGAIIQKYADRDVRYDAETRHGTKQGAQWPLESMPDTASTRPPRTRLVPRPRLEPISRPALPMPRPELESPRP